MFQKVLVTLDGSPLAESALPVVADLSRKAESQCIFLLNICESRLANQVRMAEGYLQVQADYLKDMSDHTAPVRPSIKVASVPMGSGGVAPEILEYARDHEVDLVVMSTHGRSGLDRWLMGSVSEKVVDDIEVPVLLVRPPSGDGAEDGADGASFSLDHILVPLDGSEEAQQVLPFVGHLAGSSDIKVTLLYVEEPESTPLDGSSNTPEDIRAYLNAISLGLKDVGVVSTFKVRTGKPSEEIADEAASSKVDCIAMSSHGRTGLARWSSGSISDEVLRSSHIPLLLVPENVDVEVPEHLQGPLVYRCHNCGHRTYLDTFRSEDACTRCHYLLKACDNCTHFDGAACLLDLPYVNDTYRGNQCPEFRFRKTRLVLR